MKEQNKICGNCRYMKIVDWTCSYHESQGFGGAYIKTDRFYIKPHQTCDHWLEIRKLCATCGNYKPAGHRLIIGECLIQKRVDGFNVRTTGDGYCRDWKQIVFKF